jgi:hypothetical protein
VRLPPGSNRRRPWPTLRLPGGLCRRRGRSRGRTGRCDQRCRRLLPRFVTRGLLPWLGRDGRNRGPHRRRDGRARAGLRRRASRHGSKGTSRRRGELRRGGEKMGRRGPQPLGRQASRPGTDNGQENSQVDRAGRRALLAAEHGRIDFRIGGRGHGRAGKSATDPPPGLGPVKHRIRDRIRDRDRDRGRDRDPRRVLRRQQAAGRHRSARRKGLMIAPVLEASQEADQLADQGEGRAEPRAVLQAVVRNLRQQRGRIGRRIGLGGVQRAGLRLARELRSGRKTAAVDRRAVPARAAVLQVPGRALSPAQDVVRAMIGTAVLAVVRTAARATRGRVREEMPDRQIPAPAGMTRDHRGHPQPPDPAPRSRGARGRLPENQVVSREEDRAGRPPASAVPSQSGKSQKHDSERQCTAGGGHRWPRRRR